jgi:hypothetical protein
MGIDFNALILNETPDAVVLSWPYDEAACWNNGAQAVVDRRRMK